MASASFDTLGYTKKLEAAGFTRQQANSLREIVDDRTVTKEFLDTRLRELELRLLKWQLGVGFAIVVIMAKGFGWIGF